MLIYRGIKSAREVRADAPLTHQDRSKSVPHDGSTPSKRIPSAVPFLSGGYNVVGGTLLH